MTAAALTETAGRSPQGTPDPRLQLAAGQTVFFPLYPALIRVVGAALGSDVAAGMAKYLASEFCSEVTQQSFRIHGGYGYTRDIPIERYWRDARLSEIGEGSSEVQRIVISRSILK